MANTSVNPLWWALDGITTVDTDATNKLYPSTYTRTTDHNGAADKATAFDGSTLYRSTNQAGIDTSQSYSVSTWVKINDTNGHQTAVSMAGNERSPFYLQYSAAFGAWSFTLPSSDNYSPSAYYSAVDSAPPQVGAWTHLVGTYNRDTQSVTLYVNGRAAGSTRVPAGWKATGSLNIGGETTSMHPGPDSRLNGGISDVRVYPYALTDQQVNTLATTGSSVRIRSVFSPGTCIDNWGGAVGTAAAVYDCYNGDQQHFTLTDRNQIQVPGTNRCLGTADKPVGSGTAVRFQTCGDDPAAQTWERRYDGSIYNPASNTCLELPGWKHDNGTALDVWECLGNPNQRWYFEAQTR